MNSASLFRLPPRLRMTLAGYRCRWRRVGTLKGLCLALGVFVAGVMVAVLADRMLRLGSSPRVLFLVGISGMLLFCLARWVLWPVLKRLSDRDAAVRLGRHYPRMQEDMVSAVELSASGKTEPGISASLVASALSKIDQRTVKADHRVAVSLRPLLRAAVALLLVGIIFGLAYLLRPEAVQNALHRLFRPNSAVPFFSYTKLRVEPGDHVVRTGDPVAVVAQTWGRRPRQVRLHARTGSGLLRADLPCLADRAEWQSGPLFDDLEYRVLAGDAVSAWYRVRAVPAPALQTKSAVVRDPEYAGFGERIVESIRGPLEIIQGTAVQIRAVPIARGTEPEFRCTGKLAMADEQLPLTSLASGVLCSDFFRPMASGEWLIALTDGFGLESRSPDSVLIKVSADHVPRVSITMPGYDLAVLAGEVVEVETTAEDEFGLRELALLYRTVEGEDEAEAVRWEKRELQEGGVQVRQLAAITTLDLEQLGLVPGAELEYRAEASDYADHAMLRRGRSQVYRITVMSEMQHLDWLMKKLRELQIAILRRAAEQKAEAKSAGELAEAAKQGPVNEAAQTAEAREREYARSTESVARAIEGLIPEAARNPSTPTALLSGLERLGRGVRSVAKGPMEAAAGSFGQAATASGGQQCSALSQAQGSCAEAAQKLEQLAQVVGRMQRQSILEKLAADAELLAARQRELKAATVPLAVKSAGSSRDDLSRELNQALDRLVAMQESVKSGVETLAQEVAEAAGSLVYSNPSDAATAEEAGAKLESEKVSSRAAELARHLDRNVLFSQLPEQEKVAQALTEVAEILRRSTGAQQLEAIIREIDEFIGRQRNINAGIQLAMGSDKAALAPAELGASESNLGRDVSEHASALHWLMRELQQLQSATADKLDAAAGEMKAGARELYGSDLPQGLEHGEKALALLLEAREKVDDEGQMMGSACRACRSLEAALLLQRILLGQKKVNKATASADEIRPQRPDAFSRQVANLAEKQSGLRLDTGRLQRMLPPLGGAEALVGLAGEKMDVSRMALEAGDTGRETRVVQREVVTLLEKLMGSCKGCLGGMGLSGMRALAMMQMMSRPGMRPGGFTGGTNAAILPAAVDRVGDEEWRRVVSRFADQLATGAEAQYPVEFRELLQAYFERLRMEPAR